MKHGPDATVFFHRETLSTPRGPIEIGFTDATLDLHVDHDGFDREWARLEQACGVRLAHAEQVHGRDVVVVDGPGPASGSGAAPGGGSDPAPAHQRAPRADALVTTGRGFGLATRIADCVPVLLVDPESGTTAAVHSGRPGTVLGVVPSAVGRMRDLGAGGALRAWVGPSVCAACYEVPETMRAEVAAAVPRTWAETSWGTPSVDVAGGVLGQLVELDVPVTVVEGCTREDPRLHSFRRDGQASGRTAGVVWRP